jgi:hypothetical protein
LGLAGSGQRHRLELLGESPHELPVTDAAAGASSGRVGAASSIASYAALASTSEKQ